MSPARTDTVETTNFHQVLEHFDESGNIIDQTRTRLSIQCPICTTKNLSLVNGYYDSKSRDTHEAYTVLPGCGHAFGYVCLYNWLKEHINVRNPTCPTCREPVFTSRDRPLIFPIYGDTSLGEQHKEVVDIRASLREGNVSRPAIRVPPTSSYRPSSPLDSPSSPGRGSPSFGRASPAPSFSGASSPEPSFGGRAYPAPGRRQGWAPPFPPGPASPMGRFVEMQSRRGMGAPCGCPECSRPGPYSCPGCPPLGPPPPQFGLVYGPRGPAGGMRSPYPPFGAGGPPSSPDGNMILGSWDPKDDE
ncbi:hypothetical protein GGS23DRAFT_619381 [Durotheca rogersii]|uniref:uncharacterized protein n=1 Tax=Durotheca rogersii TaxID=419775 RepID=UPI00221E4996|nr:uncharacterized protein GGS23DRAFT_619381 [Durotheca rogersii]KAI5864743.1 hypothetical protein GGS23DRAFT_619381 [Durotheca rogersii]